MDNIGIRRGIVVDNDDPESKGRVKVFIPGLYPDEFKDKPGSLPWAEPAMGIFGGSWTSSRTTAGKNSQDGSKSESTTKSLNKETGICSIPHAGTKGDGAQVWVFFDSNDIRYPVYFAVAQSGDGWFSKHNNQHSIQTDNVKIIVDEFDDYYKTEESKKVSDENVEKNTNSTPEEFNKNVSKLGGVEGLSNSLGAMNGASSLSDFISGAGGVDSMCEMDVAGLAKFVNASGGCDKLSNCMTAIGGVDGAQKVLDGTASPEATKAVDKNYGSVSAFKTSLDLVGGVEGFSDVSSKYGSVDSLINSVKEIGGSSGLSSLNSMMQNIGGSSQFKSFIGDMKNGADSLGDIVTKDAVEKQLSEMSGKAKDKKNKEVVTTCTTYTSKGNQMIKSVKKEDMKTRISISIDAGKNCAVDLNIKGTVNFHVEGDIYKEILGNVYETHIGDVFRYHKGGTVIMQEGNMYHDLVDRVVNISGSDYLLVDENKLTYVYGNVTLRADFYDLSMSKSKIDLGSKTDMNFSALSVNVSKTMQLSVNAGLSINSSMIDVFSTEGISLSSAEIDVFGSLRCSVYSMTKLQLQQVTGPMTYGSSIELNAIGMVVDTKLSRTTSITGSDATIVAGVSTLTVGGDYEVNVTGNTSLIILGSLASSVNGNSNFSVKGDYEFSVAGNTMLTIVGTLITSVTGISEIEFIGAANVTGAAINVVGATIGIEAPTIEVVSSMNVTGSLTVNTRPVMVI